MESVRIVQVKTYGILVAVEMERNEMVLKYILFNLQNEIELIKNSPFQPF